jgi:hypothetical protein
VTAATMDIFRTEMAQRAMQAVWHAVYPNEDDEPTPASLRFIDRVIATALEDSLPIGRRLERLENMLGLYLRMHGPRLSARAPVLKLV